MEAGAKGEANNPNPGAQAAGDEDLSMEEILQSIRRIIAEDDKDPKKPADKKVNGKKDEDVPGSDVFELTEMIKDDGSVVSLKETAPSVVAPAAPAVDVLSSIDAALSSEKPPEKPAAPPVEKVAEKPMEKPPEPAKAAPTQADIDAMFAAPITPAPIAAAPVETLLSSAAAKASADAFSRLKREDNVAAPVLTPSPPFCNGTTVEDLVAEMLRPMMKTWLDTNLPQIVESIVEREIRKLTK